MVGSSKNLKGTRGPQAPLGSLGNAYGQFKGSLAFGSAAFIQDRPEFAQHGYCV
jgi:hypothetical protein